ncbi:MAG TPA: O-antigen ligase family protein, partial [Thermoanaerobaculia bacterium]
MTWLRRRLSLPEETPTAVVLAIAFYLCHLFCAGWVASSEAFVAFALMAFVYAVYRKQTRPSFHILYVPLMFYAIASTVSALAATRAIHAFGENALWLKIALFPMALILFREVPRSRELALRMLLVFGAFSALYGLFQYFVLEHRDLEHRITGPAAHVMTLSGLLLAMSLVYLVLWIHDVRNLWLFAGTCIVTLALLLTFTRSAWMGWVVAATILLISKRPRMLIFAAPAVVFFVTFMPLPLFGRLVSSFDTRQSSNLDRIRMIQAGVEMIRDYPL